MTSGVGKGLWKCCDHNTSPYTYNIHGQIILSLTTCQVYACGEGTNGRLGCGGLTDVSSPKLISDLSTYVVRKVAVNTGGRHAMALTADGKVFSWGDGEYGQLGHGDNK